MHRAGTPWSRLATAAVGLALALGACGGGEEAVDPTTEQTTTAPPETTTTTVAPTPEEEVLAAYQAYWAAVDEAFGPPQVRPDLPALRQYATGEVLAGIVRRAEEVKGRDSVARLRENGQYVHRAEVLSVDSDTATVRDCNINDVVVENATTGEVIDDGVSTRLYISMLVRETGQWKVATLDRETGWEGVAGCALE